MKELINEEYEKFATIKRGLENHLCATALTDIMGAMVTVCKDDKGELMKDWSEFDEMVKGIKEMIETIQSMPNIDLKYNLQEDVDMAERIEKECLYSMRTLSWVRDDLLKKEENKDA